MPKQAKSSTVKVRQICREYPDEFSATLVRNLRCNLCDVLVKCDKKFFVESHRKSKQHQRKLETKSKSQSKQTFLQLDQVNFKEQVVSSFLAADIPLHKLNHLSLKLGLPYFEKQKSGHWMTNFHETKFMAPPTFFLSKAGR